MKKDKHKTVVSFWVSNDAEEFNAGCNPFAYFENERAATVDPIPRLSYAHIGQHSPCHPDYLKDCRPATPDEYKKLASELESIGYNLEINQ